LGILGRCDQVWASDNTDALDRTRIQDGFSLAYPARTMECWVTDEKNGATSRVSTLDLRFDVAMRGALGVGSPLNQLDDEELGRYKEFITFYKRIRPVVQEGDLYRLDTASRAGLSLWLFVAADRRRAVLSSVVLESPMGRLRGPFVLRGLDSQLTYKVMDRTGVGIGSYSGAQLMALGLPDNHRAEGAGHSVRSRTLFLEATDWPLQMPRAAGGAHQSSAGGAGET
jgi:alpha-galactosidase